MVKKAAAKDVAEKATTEKDSKPEVVNSYEFTFLVEKESQAEEVKKLLGEHGGKVDKEKKWGKRELAYDIKKLSHAYYYTWYFTLSPKIVKELKLKLNYSDAILRYLLLTVDAV